MFTQVRYQLSHVWLVITCLLYTSYFQSDVSVFPASVLEKHLGVIVEIMFIIDFYLPLVKISCCGKIPTLSLIHILKLNYQIVGRRAGDIEKVWANPDFANKELGWKAEANLEDTLRSCLLYTSNCQQAKPLKPLHFLSKRYFLCHSISVLLLLPSWKKAMWWR